MGLLRWFLNYIISLVKLISNLIHLIFIIMCFLFRFIVHIVVCTLPILYEGAFKTISAVRSFNHNRTGNRFHDRKEASPRNEHSNDEYRESNDNYCYNNDQISEDVLSEIYDDMHAVVPNKFCVNKDML